MAKYEASGATLSMLIDGEWVDLGAVSSIELPAAQGEVVDFGLDSNWDYSTTFEFHIPFRERVKFMYFLSRSTGCSRVVSLWIVAKMFIRNCKFWQRRDGD